MTPELRRGRAGATTESGRKVAYLEDLAATDDLLAALAAGEPAGDGDAAARLLAALVADVRRGQDPKAASEGRGRRSCEQLGGPPHALV
ncbi:hypothetical protein [Nonomuraea soli]|uniref:Uncharacterized protein n=1 Tax=Nonomuraea soli TaxID=1032476 RepID=A0A7W0HVI5_9ACTN|nr:hypothetical protein [Nonomuraea soli]MBA2897233.1 hypothetical protein [Nonomuraea soli]